jgi:hypothetical protein
MLRALDLSYKGNKQSFTNNLRDLTSPAKEFTSQTGYTKLIDVQKCCISDSMLLTSNS